MPVTVRNCFRGADLEVVAGSDHLDRPVSGVYLVRGPGEAAAPDRLLVLIWAPPRRGAPLPPLRPLLTRLAATAPAGLIIVTPGRTLRPPADSVEFADERGLPLAWADPEVDPAELLARLRRLAVREREDPDTARSPGSLSQVLHGDPELPALAQRLATALGGTVRILGASGGLLTQSAPLSVPAAHGVGGLGDEAHPEQAEIPLVQAGRRLGTLCVLRDRPLDATENDLIDTLTGMFVLALQVRAAEDREETPVRECLAAILGDDLAARETAVRRSRRLVLFPARAAVFAVIVPFGVNLGIPGLRQLARLFEPTVRSLDERAVVLVHEGAIVILLGADVDLDRLVRYLHRRAPVSLCVGSSRPTADVRAYSSAFRQAQRAAAIGRRTGVANRVNRFGELGVSRLLYQLPEHERQAFTQETLRSVAGQDQEAVESRRVLRSFRRNNGNIAESARQLFLHHNTFRQRLTKLQAVLGDFVNDDNVRLAVFVALDLHRLDNGAED